MNEHLRLSAWRISEDGHKFESGDPRTGMVTLGFSQAMELVIFSQRNPRESTLKTFFEALSQVMVQYYGSEPRAADLMAYVQTHFPPRIVAEGLTGKSRSPQPFDKGDGY